MTVLPCVPSHHMVRGVIGGGGGHFSTYCSDWCSIGKKIETGWHVTLTKLSELISISHEMSQDQAKFLPFLPENSLNSSKRIFLLKLSEIVKNNPTNPQTFPLQQKINSFKIILTLIPTNASIKMLVCFI